jgi:hypothetical protein
MVTLRAVGLLLLTGVGCAKVPPRTPADTKVALSEAAPPAGYVALGALAVQSGKGCGLLAERGSREDAEHRLRVAAERLGASYVRITARVEPGGNHLCLEHEYKLRGVAYRAPAPRPPAAAAPAPPGASAAPPPAVALPRVLLDYEGDGALGKPARSSARASVALSLAPGENGGSALSVTYHCEGDEPQGLLDVWYDLGSVDFGSARALTLRVKPDAALSLSVSFMDGNHTGYTQQPAPLVPGEWQTVALPLREFWHNPHGPAGDEPGAPVELGAVHALGFSPRACRDGHFLLDDVRLE